MTRLNIYILESLLAALAGLKHSANTMWCFSGVLHKISIGNYLAITRYILESLLTALTGFKHSANATWCFRGVLHSQDAI